MKSVNQNLNSVHRKTFGTGDDDETISTPADLGPLVRTKRFEKLSSNVPGLED